MDVAVDDRQAGVRLAPAAPAGSRPRYRPEVSRVMTAASHARVGVGGIAHQHAIDQGIRQPVRQHVVAIEVPVRVVGREQQHVVGAQMLEQALRPPRAVGGASNGCSVRRTCSRTISTGARSTQGTSMRRPRQNFDNRQQNAGSQLTPDSISTTFRRGKLHEHAVAEQAGELRLHALGLIDIVLDVVAGPADRGDRAAIGAAEMEPDRQVQALGLLDRSATSSAGHRADRASPASAPARSAGRPPGGRSPRPRAPGSASGSRSRRARRGSLSSHSAASQSLTAEHSAASRPSSLICWTP